jgi:hypothetical protein
VWEFVHAEKLSFKKSVVAGERDRHDVARGGPSGSNTKIASSVSVWSSSTRPGPGPIWRHCGDGSRAARGCPPRFLMAAA